MHVYIYTHLHAHNIHKYTYTHTHTYTHAKLFAICLEVPHTQMPRHVATSRLNRDKSQVTGFHKMRDTRAGNPRTESSNKSQ